MCFISSRDDDVEYILPIENIHQECGSNQEPMETVHGGSWGFGKLGTCHLIYFI